MVGERELLGPARHTERIRRSFEFVNGASSISWSKRDAHQRGELSVSELCRRFGISRKTGYE
jgi:hypothetical protein